MSHPNPSTALARVLIDELVLAGVELVVVSPGSRSAALVIAAAECKDLETVVMIDERSAAFMALGSTKAGRRAAVLSTSGSATANHFPAVVEADSACEPLVVVTADRPAELHGVGANQTIVQTEMYGEKVRSSADVPAPDEGADLNLAWRSVLADVLGAGVGVQPGPVHINAAFREPIVPVADDGRSKSAGYPYPTPRVTRSPREEEPQQRPVPSCGPGHGVIVAGDGEYDRDGLRARGEELGWPILATALSGMRGGGVVTTYHHLLDSPSDALRPDVVVAIGAVGPSRVIEAFISSVDHQIRVDKWGRINDPNRTATAAFQGDVLEVLRSAEVAAPAWGSEWQMADADMRSKLLASLDRGGVSGGAVAQALNHVDIGALVVGSSLPIREVDAHYTGSALVYGNRGASGIDGFISTASGVAHVIPRTVALCGDLTLLHDSNGFLAEKHPNLVVIVVDNNGGGLFDSLPQAIHAPEYERLFVTPPDRDLADVAQLHGLEFVDLSSVDDLAGVVTEALSAAGITLVRAAVDRGHDLDVRRSLV